MSELAPWTIQKLIQWTTQHFGSKGIPSARLDAELLLAHTLDCKRLDLYLKFDQPVTPTELKSFKELVLRRSQREPVAYILGRQEFFARSFQVAPGVLIPRPETEHLLEEALAWIKLKTEKEISVLDVGSGSGAISVTLAAEDPRIFVTALDISAAAATQTKLNAEKIGVASRVHSENIDFKKWSSLKTFDLVVSNPPYIGKIKAPSLEVDVREFEPHEALFGGVEGYETLKEWIPQIAKRIKPSGLFLCEIGYDQEELVLEYSGATNAFESLEVLKDYSGHPRLLKGKTHA